jgi:hypothetical protein
MTNVRRGVLEGRASAVAVFILFSCLGAWSWASISSHHFARDPIYLGGLAFAIFITGSVAYRSPLSVDRIAFGAAAGAFVLAIVATVVPLGPISILVVKGAKSLMWTVAAAVGLLVLVRGSTNVHRDG